MSDQNTLASSKSYITGFIASLVLTAVPFYIVATQALSHSMTYAIIFGCATVQVLVHFIYFLHMENKTSEGRWNVISLIFAAIVVLILIVGSIWIMWNLNINMMM